MSAWIGAIFVGVLIVGLGRDRPRGQQIRLMLLVIIAVVGYQTLKTHAI